VRGVEWCRREKRGRLLAARIVFHCIGTICAMYHPAREWALVTEVGLIRHSRTQPVLSTGMLF
jgi:hypothetical protein